MLSKNQLLDAIDDLESSTSTFQDCEKLATFYMLYDHLYGDKRPIPTVETIREIIIDEHGGSDFLMAVAGKDAVTVWNVLDELMDTVRAFQPRLYDATLSKLKQ